MVRSKAFVCCFVGAVAILSCWLRASESGDSALIHDERLPGSSAVDPIGEESPVLGKRYVVEAGTYIVSSRICAYFAGVSLFPTVLFEQGDETRVSIEISALSGGKADVWCGSVPSELLNGSVLEDLSVVSEGHPLVMLVFTFWLDNGTRYDRIKSLKPHSNGVMYSTWRNGSPWRPFPSEEEEDEFDIDIEPKDEVEQVRSSEGADVNSQLVMPSVSISPWCPTECAMRERSFFLEFGGSGIITM